MKTKRNPNWHPCAMGDIAPVCAERPDLPHDPGCTYRHGAGECSCDKDSRPQHSPGPWSLSNGAIYDNEGNLVLSSIDVSKANAPLIAAAPDMLDALKTLFRECAMVHKYWGENCNQTEADAAITKASAAIAKAESEAAR